MNRYSNDAAIATEVRQRLRQGWHFTRGQAHGKLHAPSGGWVSVPCTPSDHRAALNFRRDVRHLDQRG